MHCTLRHFFSAEATAHASRQKKPIAKNSLDTGGPIQKDASQSVSAAINAALAL
jgi:hypothetical protein